MLRSSIHGVGLSTHGPAAGCRCTTWSCWKVSGPFPKQSIDSTARGTLRIACPSPQKDDACGQRASVGVSARDRWRKRPRPVSRHALRHVLPLRSAHGAGELLLAPPCACRPFLCLWRAVLARWPLSTARQALQGRNILKPRPAQCYRRSLALRYSKPASIAVRCMARPCNTELRCTTNCSILPAVVAHGRRPPAVYKRAVPA